MFPVKVVDVESVPAYSTQEGLVAPTTLTRLSEKMLDLLPW